MNHAEKRGLIHTRSTIFLDKKKNNKYMVLEKITGYPSSTTKEISSNVEAFYLSFPIKKSNGKLRWINAPTKDLKIIQRNILNNYLYLFKPNNSAVGFIKNRSVKYGASVHLGNQVLMCMDIENFFNSITKHNVITLLTYLNNHCATYKMDQDEILTLAALLCFKNILPQGAPTSPAIGNLFCFSMDKELNEYCAERNIQYTRYADDMAFSHKDKTFDIGKECIPGILDIIKRTTQLKLNIRKTRVLRPHKRMEITGVIINKNISVAKYKWRNLRAQIHNLLMKKETNPEEFSLPEKEYSKLAGQIEWISSVNTFRGKQLKQEFGKLSSKN